MYAESNWPDLLEPGLRKIFSDAWWVEQLQAIAPILFNIQDSMKAQEHDLEDADVADFAPFTGSVPYDDAGEGYKTNYVHQQFARGMKIERTLVDDDLYRVIARRPQKLGLAAFRKRETDAASVFNNAFNSGFTGGDSLSLCNSAHTSNNGGPNQSNTGTTALSPTEVDTARIAMKGFLSNRGSYLNIQPDMLIVPMQLETYAYEIINANGKVDTASNNPNFHRGRYKLVVWDNYLTSSTRWFMVDSRLMKEFLLWFDRIKPEFYKDSEFDTLVAKFAGYMRYSYGWSDWRWIYGENA